MPDEARPEEQSAAPRHSSPRPVLPPGLSPCQPMLRVGIVFGGVSPEHEVSIISSHQALHALDKSRYEPVPIYIAKDGLWYTGEVLFDLDAYQDLDQLRRDAVRVVLEPSA